MFVWVITHISFVKFHPLKASGSCDSCCHEYMYHPDLSSEDGFPTTEERWSGERYFQDSDRERQADLQHLTVPKIR